jgi:hypothetical protein
MKTKKKFANFAESAPLSGNEHDRVGPEELLSRMCQPSGNQLFSKTEILNTGLCLEP